MMGHAHIMGGQSGLDYNTAILKPTPPCVKPRLLRANDTATATATITATVGADGQVSE
jgi:hypothetical protein